MAERSINRKLTTILQADVVGYSQLMARDEEAAMGMLRTYRAFVDDQIGKHGGRIFSTAGDAVLAEFSSAVEAVRCAISIQEDLRVRNAERPDESQMWFRIGVNVGDVMMEKGDLFGDGVNVAARLEGLAEKGGICISGSTFDQVKNKLSIAFKDIGPQNVKNIPYPVPAFHLVPGKVAIKIQNVPGWRGVVTRKPVWLPVAGAGVLAVMIAAAFFGGFLPYGPAAKQPFDGTWKVHLSSLSGCLDNNAREFPLRVSGGVIDEPHHLMPKKGTILADGRLRITVSSPEGAARSVITGKLVGNAGQGQLQGLKASCKGLVTFARFK
jgi:class 3 adenylate cyclase